MLIGDTVLNVYLLITKTKSIELNKIYLQRLIGAVTRVHGKWRIPCFIGSRP